MSQSPLIREKYRDAWVLMDRDVQADDNAEHLYRYLRRARSDINAYFVLQRESRDWQRLEAEGFRLIPFGSNDHAYALLNAQYLVSSHADVYVWRHLPPGEYRDLIRYKYVFLQHGCLLHDLASWLNTIPIDLVLTSSERERNSMAGPSNRYRLMPSQVALTGMPRHDALVKGRLPSERRILIMPTWRNSLVGRRLDNGTERELVDDFAQSEYAAAWKALLHDPRLKSLLDSHGYRVTFFPHTNVEPYLSTFDMPDYVDVESRAAGSSIQAAFRNARLLITDYSSVAFEVALLGRAVLYYQFDRDKIFTGVHSFRRGYFDYERDGFGPVCPDLDGLLDQLARTLALDGEVEPAYASRTRDAFRWRDGNACRRTVQAIEALAAPATVKRVSRIAVVEAEVPEPAIQLSAARG